MAKGNAAIPALIIVGAGVYFLMKSKPDSALAAGVTKAISAVKSALAGPQAAPDIAVPKAWSDSTTNQYQAVEDANQAAAPTPPQIPPDLNLLRDASLVNIIQAPGNWVPNLSN